MQSGEQGLPDSLTVYVAKCFRRCKCDRDKRVTEKFLEKVIHRSMEDGSLWKKDWTSDSLVFPTLPSSIGLVNVVNPPPNQPFVVNPPPNNQPFVHVPPPLHQPPPRAVKRSFSDITSSENHSKSFFPSPKRQKKMLILQPVLQRNFSQKDSAESPKKIVGTMSEIEKDYIRNISDFGNKYIRPPSVLKKSLKNIKDKYISGKVKYNWICNQFKSIRQDLRIQNITNDFTVRVYESHARIALQNQDVSEFSTCISALFPLYQRGDLKTTNLNEFCGYKIIYLSFTRNEKELQEFLRSIVGNSNVVNSIFFKHSITLHAAIQVNNFFKIFNYLCEQAPKMSQYLIKYFRNKDMKKYVSILIKSHINTFLPFDYCLKCLGLKNEVVFQSFLKENGFVFDSKGIDCKKSYRMLIRKKL